MRKKTLNESSLGIELSGNVVIFDEAHNIIETVNSVHSAILSEVQVSVALDHVRMESNQVIFLLFEIIVVASKLLFFYCLYALLFFLFISKGLFIPCWLYINDNLIFQSMAHKLPFETNVRLGATWSDIVHA